MESGACCNSIPGDFHDTQMTHHAENDEESNSRTRALMESAAKSLLHLTDNRTETAQLHSLQRQKLSAMPDEQDRKRFLGCLAAVVASAYEYDTTAVQQDGKCNPLEDEIFASFYDDEQEENAERQSSPQNIAGVEDQHGAITASTSMERTRRRRYQVLSRLLIDSAEYLCVEKGQAKAFLPLLSHLLTGKTLSRQHLHRKRGILERITGAPVNDFGRGDILTREIDNIPYLKMFLESLSPGAGFRCTALLLLQYLMSSQEGYDARIRRVIKTVGVLAIACDMRHDPELYLPKRKRKPDWVALATRKFEHLEHAIAYQLIVLSKQYGGTHVVSRETKHRDVVQRSQQGFSREQVMRGIKIGGTAVIAGTLFAVTGGLAAPSIAAGVAAFAGGTAAAAIFTSTAAVTTIFGVGGGSLAAYKMNRRTAGLTDFTFIKESSPTRHIDVEESSLHIEAELFSTVCISGWLRDKYDFQRPWGVMPSKPCLTDRVELLERFYSIHRPDQIPKVHRILSNWKGEEKELWALLKQKYGTDPDHLFPLDRGPRFDCALTLDDRELLSSLFVELGYIEMQNTKHKSSPFDRLKVGWLEQSKAASPPSAATRTTADSSIASLLNEDCITLSRTQSYHQIERKGNATDIDSKHPRHLSTVWDYGASYGGELYTVKWESNLLLELCDSVSDLAFDVVGGGTTRILLSHTVFSTLLSAFAWPLALINAANLIDGTWTLAVERADQAGIELAQSLLFSEAGKRPVTLVGYSFGARAIYSCLKELARHQEKWEAINLILPNEDDGLLDERVYRSGSGFDNEQIDETYYRKMREPSSVVEDAVLMGLPNHLSISSWLTCRSIVAGRLVNCFSQRDMILSLMFQVKRFGIKPVCGTCPVAVPGVENIDVSDLVKGHQDYCLIMGEILKRIRHCQPFRSRPARGFVPDLSLGDGKRIEKYDV